MAPLYYATATHEYYRRPMPRRTKMSSENELIQQASKTMGLMHNAWTRPTDGEFTVAAMDWLDSQPGVSKVENYGGSDPIFTVSNWDSWRHTECVATTRIEALAKSIIERAEENDPFCRCGCRKSNHYNGRGMCERSFGDMGVCQCSRFKHETEKEKKERRDE